MIVIMYMLGEIPNMHIKLPIAILIITLFNIQCAHYLYKQNEKKKLVWAFVGFFGNFLSVFIFWTYNFIKNKWKKGESIFGTTPFTLHDSENDSKMN